VGDSRMRTSIVIPCVGKHIPLLPELVKAYEAQTVLPDEIILAVSDKDPHGGELLLVHSDKIPVTISITKKAFAGANRNRGGQLASGDLLIYNDADDLPHPQRVEITKHFFETQDIVHLNGLWTHTNDIMPPYNLDRIPFITARELLAYAYNKYQPYCYKFGFPVHCGNVAILKSVLKQVRWCDDRKGQDTTFCFDVLYALRKSIVVTAYLVKYRLELSSWKRDVHND
jgi:glycosyltransferase involved in cell wall biosynthesis